MKKIKNFKLKKFLKNKIQNLNNKNLIIENDLYYYHKINFEQINQKLIFRILL